MYKNIEDLKHIRSMMERSTKFLSISGISGVVAGLSALIGGWLVYLILYTKSFHITSFTLYDVVIVALGVLSISALAGFYFSYRKAKKVSQKLWSNVTLQIIKDTGVPVFCGAILTFVLLYHKIYNLIPTVMLVFVGLGFIYAGAKTYRDIKFLGAVLIFLGFLAGFFSDYCLLFWILGFGISFLIYGIVHFNKYERTSLKDKL